MPTINRRIAASIEGDFVVFIIGARFNRWWKLPKYRDQTHYPYWVKFNKEIGSNGDIGIWHETFLVRAGEYECIYNNMPLRGLAKAAHHVDATGRAASAAGRVGRTDGSDAAVGADGAERGREGQTQV